MEPNFILFLKVFLMVYGAFRVATDFAITVGALADHIRKPKPITADHFKRL